jgi:hypothetical protein
MRKSDMIKQVCEWVNPRLAYELKRRGQEVREVSYKDVLGFWNDKAAKKSKNQRKFAKQVFDMALNTYPNYDEETEVIIKDDLYYVVINKGQYDALVNKLDELYSKYGRYYGSVTVDKLPIGAFFTNDESILRVKNEEALRQKVALSHLFKEDVYAVVVVRADNTPGTESLIGPQFDFGNGNYLKAPMVEQLEVSMDNKKYMNFVKVKKLEDIYEK